MSRTKEFLADVEAGFEAWYAETAPSCKLVGEPDGLDSAIDAHTQVVAARAYRAGFLAGMDRALFKLSDPDCLRRLGDAIMEPQDDFEASCC